MRIASSISFITLGCSSLVSGVSAFIPSSASVRGSASSSRSKSCTSISRPLKSSYYDAYDYDKMRNMEKDRPDWAGGGPISSLVSALIGNEFLYGLMKVGARKVLIENAEKKGVEWTKNADELMSSDRLKTLFDEKFAASHKNMDYPWYYTQPFHAYSEGNLNWLAAAEVESATSSMCLRVWPKDEEIQPKEAADRLRYSYLQVMENYMKENQVASPSTILDVGCSAGISTRYAKEAFPSAKEVVGLDLSPHFLAVAQLREEQQPKGVKYMHAKAEATGLPAGSQDIALMTFIVHELPSSITRDIAVEMLRILKPGGVIAITDNDPRSPIIQKLPKPIAVLMKSTEPFSDEYYSLNMESMLEEVGFTAVKTVATDPRHRTILVMKPKA